MFKGDWPVDAGSAKNWDAAEPLGLLTYDQDICAYVVVVKGLKESFDYKWKITIDNAWKENYGRYKYLKSVSQTLLKLIKKPILRMFR